MYGKGLAYDGALHVPLISRGPGIRASVCVDTVASLLEVAPTVLDLAHIEEPEGVQGDSLAPVLAGQAAPKRTASLTENDDDFVPMKMRVLTTAGWKLVTYAGETYGELYDRHNDPDEVRNR
jgi:arylsulfatase A-like enzyme